MLDLENQVIEFTAHDRCDRCGAQAYSVAQKGTQELLFCAHHGKRHLDTLVFEGWTVVHDTLALERLATPIDINHVG